jgi:2-polyprenylphenol 6-hydroxylase
VNDKLETPMPDLAIVDAPTIDGPILDVLIVGGGPVGACAAALLLRGSAGTIAPLRVAILEPRRPSSPLPGSPFDSRVVAVSRASERILESAGAWSRVMGPRVAPYERMRIWHESAAPSSAGALVFDAAEVGEPNLGYIVESRLLQAAVLDAFAESGGRVVSAQLRALRVGADCVTVETSGGSLSARLVIGADGAHSVVREAVGLTAEVSDFQQTAIVATVATERPHESTAWQRFMRDGTLALLPLADGTSSIVWSADNAVATRLVALSSADFATELDRASDLALGATRIVSERVAFPLQRLSAHRYITQRCALIGDAAHVVHPLAGQGVNLGLLDAAALAELATDAAREKEDPGAFRVLRRYERWRKSEMAFMTTAISAFDRFLAHGSGPVSKLAQRGLGWVNRSPELKRFFVSRALGVTGELPRAAR